MILLGPSGCGKSTLLRCLSGLEEISSGQILMDGKDITNLEPKDRNIGMVFQHYSLFPNMTVEENIAFGLKMKKKPEEEIKKKVKEAMEMVELTGKEKEYPDNLSGGQQQRVALARSIVQQPKVLLLDEPLSAIDAKLRKSLQNSIREVHKKLGLTSIFVTHDQDEAMIMSDTIHLFHEGKIEQSSNPIEMYTSPVSKFAATFIGNYNILSEKQFQTVTGHAIIAPEGIAIRPETLPELRACSAVYGPIALVHFDAHYDTIPEYFGKPYSHGTPFYHAAKEGLVDTSCSIQLGIRERLYGSEDAQNSANLGYESLKASEMHHMTSEEIIRKVYERTKGTKVFLTFDIDFLDPAYAPGTGTPVQGGFSTWEALELIRGLKELDIVGYDIVEVAPAFDGTGITSIAAAGIIQEFMALIAWRKKNGKL